MARKQAWFPFLPTFLLLLSACALSACAGNTPAFQAAADIERARNPQIYGNGTARAYQVSRAGLPRGLLWGTLHIPYGTDTLLPAPIRARFYAAADLTVETILDQAPDAMRALADASRHANLATDPALPQRLDPATRAALAEVPGANLRTLSLRGAATVLAMAAARPYDPGALPDDGFTDLNLVYFACAQDRPVHGLEPPGTQDPTLADPNGPEAAALHRRHVRQRDTKPEFDRWVSATYAKGDVASAVAGLAAWAADAQDMRMEDRNRAALYTARNAAWLPQLDARLQQPGDHFIAIGAGHLLGSDGLVALLRTKGYQVTPCPHDACPPASRSLP